MPPEEQSIPFITDDEAPAELRLVANGLRDLQARLPSLASRLEAVAERLWPKVTRAD